MSQPTNLNYASLAAEWTRASAATAKRRLRSAARPDEAHAGDPQARAAEVSRLLHDQVTPELQCALLRAQDLLDRVEDHTTPGRCECKVCTGLAALLGNLDAAARGLRRAAAISQECAI